MPLVFKLPFRYCTLDYLRTIAGIDDTTIPDDRALRLIEMASQRINRVTDQWFLPVYMEQTVSGQGHKYLFTLSHIPIIWCKELQLIEDFFVAPYIYETTEYKIHDSKRMVVRYPAFFYTGRRKILWEEAATPFFVDGTNNYKIKGLFGWIDEYTDPFSLVTADPISPGATSVTLVSGAETLRVGDVINILNPESEERARLIITEINGQVLTCDPLTFVRAGIPAGAQALCYGRVPEDIQEACARLVADYAVPFGSEDGIDRERCGVLRSESTDGYSWSRSGSMDLGWARGDPGKAQNSTGNSIVDAMLSNWQAPSIIEPV